MSPEGWVGVYSMAFKNARTRWVSSVEQTIDKRRDIAKREADRAMQRALKARR